MLKAVIFDIDDTLYDQQIPFTQALQTYLGTTSQRLEIDAAFQQFGQITEQLFAKVSQNNWPLSKFQATRFNTMLASQGCNPVPANHVIRFELQYQQALQRIQLFQGLSKTLTQLSQHYRLGIITNGPAEQQQAKIHQLHLDKVVQHDNIFISSKVGIVKPDPAIFTKLAHQLGYRAHEMAYVGDNYFSDITGAKHAGWQAFWFNHRNRLQPNDGPIPDQTVTSPAELNELLAALSEEQLFASN